VPLYRFLILPGHDFQNYPAQVIKSKKPKENDELMKFQNQTTLQMPDNILKWMMCPKSKAFLISKNSAANKLRRLSSQNVASAPSGYHVKDAVRKSKTLKMETEYSDTHVITNQYRIFHDYRD